MPLGSPVGAEIYYTTDGSDPRLADNSANPAAAHAVGPITVDIAASTQIKARIKNGSEWSAIIDARFVLPDPFPLRITELHFHPADHPSVLDPEDMEGTLAKLGGIAKLIGATLRNTANPTQLGAGYKVNVIPGEATAHVDGRFLPGFEEEFLADLDKILGPKVRREDVHSDKALETSFDGAIVDAMQSALLAEDPDDAFLRYGLAMEHASAGDDAECVRVLQDLIARKANDPYVPAFLQAGQALVRLDRITEACAVLREGIDVAGRLRTPDALHAQGEMQGLLSTIE